MPVNVEAPSETPMHRRAMAGARARWGPQRIVRLDALDRSVRAAILALIEADQAAKRAAAEDLPATAQEARRATGEPG
jgi:hypothetical protein